MRGKAITNLVAGTSTGTPCWKAETSCSTSAPASAAPPMAVVPIVSSTPVTRVAMDEMAAMGNL